MTTLSNTFDAVTRIVAIYNQCSSTQQALLRVLGVINKRIGQTKFISILKELNHFDSFAQQQLHREFDVALKNKLASDGLIDLSPKGIKISVYLAQHLCRQCVDDNSYEEIVDAAELIAPVAPIMHWQEPTLEDRQRLVRDYFYRRRFDVCEELLAFHKNPQVIDHDYNRCLVELCFYPLDLTEFYSLPAALQYQAYASLLYQMRANLIDNSSAIKFLAKACFKAPNNDNLRLLLAEQLLLDNQLSHAQSLLHIEEKSSYGLQLCGCYAFLSGQPEACCEFFELAIKAKNKINRRKKQYIGGLTGVLYSMALLQLGSDKDPGKLSVLAKYLDYQNTDNKGIMIFILFTPR